VNVETEIVPPEPVEDGEEQLPSMRVAVHVIDVDDACYDAGVQLMGDDADDPERFAEAVLAACLAAASLRSPDCLMATVHRLARYDGTGVGGRRG
jgi:uncharacterized UPF0146 family protein